jgi:dienelactone hydrolase
LELFDLATQASTLIEKDPKDEVDFGGSLFSDVTNEMLATFYVGDRVRIYPKTKKFEALYARMKKALPDGEISFGGVTADESLWMLSISSDVDPGSRYIFDAKTGKAEFLYKGRPELPTQHLVAMKPVRINARDGLVIPAYLSLPKGVPAKNLPVIMYIHGGPWGRDSWGYNSAAQFFANRGYAVLQPNFRGSAGFGKKFLNAGNKEWGTGAMQHDITDAVQYLIKEGIADPKRVGIYGGSYGGYATLAGLAFTPDLYAAGVSFVGPSNIITLLKTIPPYWAPMKKMFDVRVGDMDNPEDLKRLEEQSPLNSATKIKAPLLVVQGANDPRVKKSESDQIVVAMRDLGRSVEYIVAPDEGHGFAGKENRLAFYTATEHFFAKHLKGRMQESVAPEIKAKLASITVDVKTVTKPPPPAEIAAGPMPSFNGALLKATTSSYVTKIAMMGREITLNSTRTVAQSQSGGKKIWRVIEESTSPMGASSDTLDLDEKTLLPIRRSGKQGMATMAMTFTPELVEGKIIAGPQTIPVNAKLTGPVLSDGAGTEIPLCTLPLAAGYKASISTFDMMGGKAKTMMMKVATVENVTIGAGTFEAFKVELTGEGGEGNSTLWVSKKDLRLIKKEAKLPAQMGGGTAVTEFVK